MAMNLEVNEGTTVVLDGKPPRGLARSLERYELKTLRDLVTVGLIDSENALTSLLDSAKQVTTRALSSRDTFRPFMAVPGTTRPDLRRFGDFLTVSSASVASRFEAEGFWRVARAIEPEMLDNVNLDTPLKDVSSSLPGITLKYGFNDILVNANSVLVVASDVQQLTCRNLLIKKTGMIEVQGGGIAIKAFSIQGEQ
jgi:hypothetical protein